MIEFALALDSSVVKPPPKVKIEKLERDFLKKAKYLNMPLADASEELRRIRSLETNPEGWDRARLVAAKKHPSIAWLNGMNILFEVKVDKREVEFKDSYLVALGAKAPVISQHVIIIRLFDKSTAAWFKLTWNDHFLKIVG
jgi:hypothetical protein